MEKPDKKVRKKDRKKHTHSLTKLHKSSTYELKLDSVADYFELNVPFLESNLFVLGDRKRDFSGRFRALSM